MRRFAQAALLSAVLLPASSASAVIYASNDAGTSHTSEPYANSGWGNVGSVDGASGVYLGNGWVLTAYHVRTNPPPTGIDFGGSLGFFAADTTTRVRLSNGDSTDTDLQVFRLLSDPGLPTLNLANSTPLADSSVLMVGVGRNRAADLTNWDVTGSDPDFTWTVDPTPEGGEEAGYFWAGGQTKRWGNNNIFDSNGATPGGVLVDVNSGFGNVISFRTTFDPVIDEGQAAAGDSGGGVFDGAGNLVGLMHAIGTFEDQPASTAVFGNLTYIADIATYRQAIIDAIPEPSTVTLLLVGASVWLSGRRRRINPSPCWSVAALVQCRQS